MTTQKPPKVVIARGRILALVLAIAAALCAALPSGLLGAESSPMPGAAASLTPTIAPAEAACQSADDLRLIVDYLRGIDASEDGWLPVFVGAVAALSEARTLAGLVEETYRPLVDDLMISLQGLRTTMDELQDQETAGAQLAAIGESITDIGDAMDALSVQLRTPCPTDE